MNLAQSIAKKIAFGERKTFSVFIIRIAIGAVALSVAVMLIGISMIHGFQQTVKNKFFENWGHLQVINFKEDANNFNDNEIISLNSALMLKIKSHKNVSSINTFLLQGTIAKNADEPEGILLKGIDNKYDWTVFKKYLKQGSIISFSEKDYNKEIILSENLLKKLNTKLGNDILLYFLNQNESTPRIRKVKVVGIYQTGLEEYDNIIAICDSRMIQQVLSLASDKIHGYEIHLKEISKLEKSKAEIFENFVEPPLHVYSIKDRFESIFSWLNMMKANENLLIIIMLIVSIMNMITAILILILERTSMIGILKTLGMKNFSIQKIFIYSSAYIIFWGLLIGNILGYSICFLQYKFGILKLNESVYYIKKVPIVFEWSTFVFINSITLISILILLFIPTIIIKKISSTKALKLH
ncbi:MAG: ABC transporter permease [Chitinophagaceae bacterium]|nr:ABC transporter permease [Chitinophagaceae bacterium]